jgi:trimeric autotransporter adhesin
VPLWRRMPLHARPVAHHAVAAAAAAATGKGAAAPTGAVSGTMTTSATVSTADTVPDTARRPRAHSSETPRTTMWNLSCSYCGGASPPTPQPPPRASSMQPPASSMPPTPQLQPPASSMQPPASSVSPASTAGASSARITRPSRASSPTILFAPDASPDEAPDAAPDTMPAPPTRKAVGRDATERDAREGGEAGAVFRPRCAAMSGECIDEAGGCIDEAALTKSAAMSGECSSTVLGMQVLTTAPPSTIPGAPSAAATAVSACASAPATAVPRGSGTVVSARDAAVAAAPTAAVAAAVAAMLPPPPPPWRRRVKWTKLDLTILETSAEVITVYAHHSASTAACAITLDAPSSGRFCGTHPSAPGGARGASRAAMLAEAAAVGFGGSTAKLGSSSTVHPSPFPLPLHPNPQQSEAPLTGVPVVRPAPRWAEKAEAEKAAKAAKEAAKAAAREAAKGASVEGTARPTSSAGAGAPSVIDDALHSIALWKAALPRHRPAPVSKIPSAVLTVGMAGDPYTRIGGAMALARRAQGASTAHDDLHLVQRVLQREATTPPPPLWESRQGGIGDAAAAVAAAAVHAAAAAGASVKLTAFMAGAARPPEAAPRQSVNIHTHSASPAAAAVAPTAALRCSLSAVTIHTALRSSLSARSSAGQVGGTLSTSRASSPPGSTSPPPGVNVHTPRSTSPPPTSRTPHRPSSAQQRTHPKSPGSARRAHRPTSAPGVHARSTAAAATAATAAAAAAATAAAATAAAAAAAPESPSLASSHSSPDRSWGDRGEIPGSRARPSTPDPLEHADDDAKTKQHAATPPDEMHAWPTGLREADAMAIARYYQHRGSMPIARPPPFAVDRTDRLLSRPMLVEAVMA